MRARRYDKNRHPMNRITTLLFVTLLFAAAAAARATDNLEDAFAVTRIEVLGLERTKPYVVEDVLQKYLGLDSRTIDLNDVHAAVADLNIVEPEKVEIVPNEEGQTLSVTVADKWPFIGFPLFLMNSDGLITAGLMAMNMNAFGMGNRIIAIGMWNADYRDVDSTSGGMALLNYSHNTRSAFLPKWTFSLNYSGGKNVVVTDQEARALHRWKTDSLRASVALRYELFNKAFVPQMGIAFANLTLRRDDGDVLPPDRGFMCVDLAPSLRVRTSDFDGFLMSEKSASLAYVVRMGIDSDTTGHLDFNGKFERSLLPGFKLASNVVAVFSPQSNMQSGLYPSAMGERMPVAAILPAGYMARHYFGANAGFEKYVYRWKYALVSLLLNYQIVESYAPDLEWQFDHGLGGGVSVYLPRVAIPAIKVTSNYNVARNHFSMAFSVGTSF
jgi:hypothetical protein